MISEEYKSYMSSIDQIYAMVESGDYTYDEAIEAIDELDKTVEEATSTKEKVAIGLGVGAAVAAIAIPLGIKIAGAVNFSKNLSRFPEIAEEYRKISDLYTTASRTQKEYDALYNKANDIIARYEDIRKTVGAPTITITYEKPVTTTVYDNVGGWKSNTQTITDTKVEQNRNYDPVLADKVKGILNDLIPILRKLDKYINELSHIKHQISVATLTYLKVLKKSAKKVKSDKYQLKLALAQKNITKGDYENKLKEYITEEDTINKLLDGMDNRLTESSDDIVDTDEYTIESDNFIDSLKATMGAKSVTEITINADSKLDATMYMFKDAKHQAEDALGRYAKKNNVKIPEISNSAISRDKNYLYFDYHFPVEGDFGHVTVRVGKNSFKEFNVYTWFGKQVGDKHLKFYSVAMLVSLNLWFYQSVSDFTKNN